MPRRRGRRPLSTDVVPGPIQRAGTILQLQLMPPGQQAAELIAMDKKGKKISALLRYAVTLTSYGSTLVESLSGSDDGKALLDRLVDALDSSGNQQQRQFGAKAIQARFKIAEVPASHSGRGIKAMWGALKILPADHVATGAAGSVKNIVRGEKRPGGGGDNKGGTITMNYSRLTWASHIAWTTLHEVGHSVDAVLNVMFQPGSRFRKEPEFDGPWGDADPAATMIEGNMVEEYVNEGHELTPRQESELGKVLRAAAQGTLKAAERKRLDAGGKRLVAAVEWGKGKERWEASVSDRQKYAVNGRNFYIGSGETGWMSRPVERSNQISQYQYSSPKEWFAEIYANWYSGKKQGNPPINTWFEKNVANNVRMDPAAVLGVAPQMTPASSVSLAPGAGGSKGEADGPPPQP
jgi:hypothetical protein